MTRSDRAEDIEGPLLTRGGDRRTSRGRRERVPPNVSVALLDKDR